MSDEMEVAPPPEPAGQGVPPPPRRAWPRVPPRLSRYTRRAVIVAVALVAAALVSVVTVDLGPVVRAQAERAASARIERPVRIGRLGTYLLPGRFLVEDLVIEGLSPDDEPFLTTERIVVTTSWLALLRGEILVDGAEMANWRMLVESFPDGRHSFPRFAARQPEGASPAEVDEPTADPEASRRIVTTLSRFLAHAGEFEFRDHGAPWTVVARHINLTIAKGEGYGGTVAFSDGTVQIGSFEPMTTAMDATYTLDGAFVDLTRIDLTMDGFRSKLTGEVDLLHWPEQTYHIIESDIDLPPMKEIFFAEDNFTTTGRASFVGSWHLFDGGRELAGTFSSDDATLNGLRFPALEGALVWTSDRFEVYDAASGFYGGTLDFDYSMKPLGKKTPGVATFDTVYRDVEIVALLDELEMRGVRPEGRATGRNTLRWPLGRFAERTGEGQLAVAPVSDVRLMTNTGGAEGPAPAGSYAAVPFSRDTPWHFPVGGAIAYTIGPETIEIEPSWLATPRTQIAFEGSTAYGGNSRIPFRVNSADWQESDRLMASFMTAFGATTGEFSVGGRGRIDGVMLDTFASPRIQARFDGLGIEAWNVEWGVGEGTITVADGYLDVAGGRFSREGSTLSLDGRFALGSRTDGGDEIDASFAMSSFPAERIREAFGLEGYRIDGPLSGTIALSGPYRRPFGEGQLVLTNPRAYGEPFDSAAARLRFEGNGVRIEGLDVRKDDGTVTGAAFVRWDGTYSFNAEGRDIEASAIESARVEGVPLGGVVSFTAEGAGAFADPRYEVRGTVSDLTVSGERVGAVSGRVDVRDGLMGFEAEAASPRLAVSGSGRIELETTDAELLFRFTNTTIDPYVRAFRPDLPDGLSAEVSGTLQILGALSGLDQVRLVSTVEQLDLDVFDYEVQNQGPVLLNLDQNVFRVDQMHLVGDGTALEVTGTVDVGAEQKVALRATGDAGLSLLEGFFPDVRSSGNARLVAEVGGTIAQPQITGDASLDGGRVRHLSFPHGLEAIDGRIVFEPNGIRVDGLTGTLGGGQVRFGGRVGLDGYSVGELNVTASGTGMRLRFPEGVRSLVDAELALVGGAGAPVLSGAVEVRDAVLLELFETNSSLLDFGSDEALLVTEPVASSFPLRFDVRINAPSSLRISDNTARVVSSAELQLGGTYDKPLLFGNAEIERGEVFFEGNRYRVTQGSIGFSNPSSIEPFFDIEAETDVRAPGQTYRVTLGVVGTMERLDFELASDPPLPEFEIMSLLLGNIRDPQAAELRTLRAQDESRQELFQAGAARLLTSPLSSGVGRVVEESFGVDTFQITPSLVDPSAQQSAQLLPTARLLIGKRISDRAHVTLSRTLTGANQDIIVVLEYDQSDRLSWVLSQNEDRTYALDFRMRHAF